ncbi:MAG: hypothetical protein KTR28_02010 [Micavibrio sp.]|nr:hypothetical protein [Micavibrio sp.]
MKYSEIQGFCNSLVRQEILPVLSENYAQLCQNAAEKGAAFFNDPSSNAAFKSDGKGIVSEGEVLAERIIREKFKAQFDDFQVWGEELGDEDEHKDYTLVIDPVDGTSSMVLSAISGEATLSFAITLGFMKGDEFIGGLIYELQPAGDALRLSAIYSAWQGEGAYKDDKPFTTRKSKSTIYCTAPNVMFTGGHERAGFFELQKNFDAISEGQNCIGFMQAIEEENSCAIEADLSIHDIAALIPILKEAGLKATDLQGKELAFKGLEAEYKILTAHPELHKNCIQHLNKVYNQAGADTGQSPMFEELSGLNTRKFKTEN